MSEDLESRILVISASLDQARTAVKLIKAFVDDTSEEQLPSSNSIPWTIKNKYYSADVHFHLIEYAHWDPQSTRRVPAVIFVWARGQPYAEHVFALHNGLSRFEPEVALAIALGHEPPHDDDPPEGPDSFLADHGFEYIDGERTRYPEKIVSASEENGEDEEDEDDVQGLSRVVDALSTIMWPTMIRKQANNIIGGKRESRELRPSLIDFDEDDEDDDDILLADDDDDEEATLAALMEADAVDQGAPQTRASRMRTEMQALERWLIENEELHEREFGAGADGVDGDDDGDEDHDAPLPSVQVSASATAAPGVHAAPVVVDDPWAASTTSNPTSTSTQTQTHSTTLVASHSISITTTRSSGFDDDFSAFVSGPRCPSQAMLHQQLRLPPHRHLNLSLTRRIDSTPRRSCSYHPTLAAPFVPRCQTCLYLTPGMTWVWVITKRSMISATTMGIRAPRQVASDLATEQPTVREDVAGIEDEAERRATTARFASEFVYKRMGVDDGEGKETEG
ncbi:hypothetical protein BGY98DRAFT_635701 [Russula aff. rugulosa BPL654]|nr:hypothetical protein BGY98DRAFT_635701 [Russula aff. rugulosa BPL654]